MTYNDIILFSQVLKINSLQISKESIGMDFGTCNSNKAEALVNIISNKLTTPTYVNLNTQEIGYPVKNLETQDKQIVHSFKRLIGRNYQDKEVQETIKRVNYDISEQEGKLIINNKYKPEDLASIFMQQFANQCQINPNSRLVVTVPAYYNSLQKELTMKAANKAGLTVDRLIAEPTAAALQYNSQFPSKNNEIIMVCDLGAGTLDVSLIEKIDDCYNVIAVSGDNFFGGNDFSQVIRDQVQKQCGKDINLSMAEQIKIYLDKNQFYNKDDINIKKSQIEQQYNDLLEKLERPIRQVLLDSGLEPQKVDKILLVGGQTRAPEVISKIQEIMQKKPLQSLNPDHCVAQGAAIQHAILQKQINSVLLLDATPFSLGIETTNGVFSKIINRNSTLPAKQSEVFTTTVDNQKYVEIKIYQGESQIAANNSFLNQFSIEIDPQPKGAPRINVEFVVNQNGVVEVKATDLSNGKEKKCKVSVLRNNDDNNHNVDINEQNEREKQFLIGKIQNFNKNIKRFQFYKKINLNGNETLEQLKLKCQLAGI